MSKREVKPFLKWVGGKRSISDDIVMLINKKFNKYFEPFLGGGAIFFELYSRGLLKGKRVVLSDINSELINSYIVVRDKPLELIKRLSYYRENHNKDFYYKIRGMDREKGWVDKYSDVERASRFIYLNKTCFNGLYRVNKKGEFNVPMGVYINPNILDKDVILSCSKALHKVDIRVSGYKDLMVEIKKGDMVYMDPPYFPLNRTSSFVNYDKSGFLEKEQEELYKFYRSLDKKGVQLLLSNSDTVYIKNLYKRYKIDKIKVGRNINSNGEKRGKINEIIVTNI